MPKILGGAADVQIVRLSCDALKRAQNLQIKRLVFSRELNKTERNNHAKTFVGVEAVS